MSLILGRSSVPQIARSAGRRTAPVPSRVQYMGDPGLFGFLGDVAKGIGGAVVGGITGLVTGGPLGALGGAIGGSGIIPHPTPPLLNPKQPMQGTSVTLPGGGTMVLPGFVQQNGQATGVRVGGLLPGGEKPYIGYDYAGNQMVGAPSGYHPNKTDYFLRDGTFVPKGTKLVKNRRRNPANSKATNRAISRVAQAKRHAKDLSRITIRSKSSCK